MSGMRTCVCWICNTDFVIFEIENNRIPSHYELLIKSFHSMNETFLLNISIKEKVLPRFD